MKQATTLDQQISKYRERNIEISDVEKAKEILLDIGYYRLGFYFFPFEETYPDLYPKQRFCSHIGTFMYPLGMKSKIKILRSLFN